MPGLIDAYLHDIVGYGIAENFQILCLPGRFYYHAWPTATDDEIQEACRLANCDGFIRDMEKGCDTEDIENELLVKQAVANLLKADKTVVMIAHTLSIIRNADQILVLDGGRIVESGTHEELVVPAANIQPCGGFPDSEMSGSSTILSCMRKEKAAEEVKKQYADRCFRHIAFFVSIQLEQCKVGTMQGQNSAEFDQCRIRSSSSPFSKRNPSSYFS